MARELHAGQYYHGTQYDFADFHLLPGVLIARQLGGSETDEAILWLHDTVEDTEASLGDLAGRGVTSDVLAGVDLLTRWPSLSRREYLSRLVADPQVGGLKIIDSTVNLDATFRRRRHMSAEEFDACVKNYAGNIAFLAPRFLETGPGPAWSQFARGQAGRAEATLRQHFGQLAVSHAQGLQRPAFAS